MEKILNILLIFLIVLYKNIMYWPMVTSKFLYALIIIIAITAFLSFGNKKIKKKHFLYMLLLAMLINLLLSKISTDIFASFIYVVSLTSFFIELI